MTKVPKNSNADQQGSMEQVRDLLFGAQWKEMEVRLGRQAEGFEREITDTKETLKKRLDTLENFMKSEIATVLHRIKENSEEQNAVNKAQQRERLETIQQEQRERGEGFKQASKELAALAETLERKIAMVTNTLDTAERELRKLLATETASLSDKIDAKYITALDTLSSTASQIREDMVYRSSLSTMFNEVAVSLSGQRDEGAKGNTAPGQPTTPSN